MGGKLNLNADLGESFGPWSMGNDAAMLDIVDSANIACGFHGGDPAVMLDTAKQASAKGVSIGAHPSFPDLQGFGRRRMDIPPAELTAMLIYQIGALMACARACGAKVTHVKPHGALNNIACEDPKIARIVADAIHCVDPEIILLGPAASQIVCAGKDKGLAVIEEIFADRAYRDDGNLVPRGQPGAMIHGAKASLEHVMRIVGESALISINGKRIPVNPQSICVHGDNETAVATAKALREGLIAAGYSLHPLPELR